MKDTTKLSILLLFALVSSFVLGFWAGTSPAESVPVQTVYVEVAAPTTTTSTTIVEAEVPEVAPPPVFAPQPEPEMIPKPQINQAAVIQRTIHIHAEWELEVDHLWDVSPPDRIDIIMWPDSMEIYKESAQTRCENMGGELIYNPGQQQFICEDVDY